MNYADDKVYAALKSVMGENAYPAYPTSYAEVPAAWYETVSNVPASAADDDEYMSRLTYYVNITAETLEELRDYETKINDAMKKQGFTRGSSIPLYDDPLEYHRTIATYRILL